MTSETPQAAENDHNGPQTITVHWAPTAIEQAIERLRAIVESQASGPDVTHVVAHMTITWMDLACLLDITRAVQARQTEVEQLRADVDRWQQTALAATEDREEASENAATHAKKASELASENDRLRRALATHLFDREALSILQATPVELIEQQHAELIRQRESRAALSSLLRGMARRVSQKRKEIRELAGNLVATLIDERRSAPAVSEDQPKPCPVCDVCGGQWLTEHEHVCPLSEDQSTPREPRVWREGDAEPEDLPKVRDKQHDVWTYDPISGLWHTPDTTPFEWQRVVKKWGPVTEVLADSEQVRHG